MLITINKMETIKPSNKILKLMLKDFTTKHTVTSISKEISMSRVGAWKVLKKLESEKLILLSSVGSGKTSTYTISLNWENPIVEKMLAMILTEETLKNQRWLSNFSELEGKTEFSIIYGSILKNPKEANDIDIINIVSSKKNFIDLERIITKVQKTQTKKIHASNFTQKEFKNELKKPNKIFIDAIKKGAVLFGQERFIQLIRRLMT